MTRTKKAKAEYNRRYAGTVGGRAATLVGNAKTRARKKGLAFTLTVADIIPILQAGHCQVTGLKFYMERNTLRSHPFAPSLDRRNPRQGYTPSNVRVVVDIYNRAKSDHTHEAVVALAKAIMQQEK